MMSTPTVLAAFMTPALFAGGAVAMAAPIAIHLLARRRFRVVRWAAMDFLLHADRHNRRRVRMEEWILLALRCLALLLIGMLLARPFLRPAGLAMFGGSQRSERVFLLDDSFSMAYEGEGGTPFDRAKEAVRRLITSIRQETPDDTVTLIRSSDPEHPIASGVFLSDDQAKDLLERLEALAPSQQGMNLSRFADEAAAILARNPEITSAAVYLVSDFQTADWSRGNTTDLDRRSAGHPLAALGEWAKDERALQLVLIDVHEDGAGNTAVTDLAIHSGQLVAGTTGTVQVAVANLTESSLDAVTLDVTVGNLAQPSQTLKDVMPFQTTTVGVEVEVLRSGFDTVRVELSPDRLGIDNVRYLSMEVVPAVRMLLVNGEPSADSYDDELTFLATALRPEGEVFSGNELVIVDEAGFEEADLSTVHLVVLANVYRVSEPAIDALERYVRRGGGLLMFLGDQVDPDEFNVALYRSGDGLSPARLTEIVRSPSAAHLVVVDRLHPSMRGFGGEGDPLGIGQIPFFEYFGAVIDSSPAPNDRAADGAAVDVTGAGITDTRGGGESQSVRVVARFDDDEAHPAIIERLFGAGRVVLVTTTADKEWHLWPNHPTFLPVMMELAAHVSRRARTGDPLTVGMPIQLTIDPGRFEADVTVRSPSYPSEQEAGVTAAPEEGQPGLSVSWDHTSQAGVYHFVLRGKDGSETIRAVAVNVDPHESDLTPASEDELRRSVGDLPMEYIRGIDRLAGSTGEARTEFWRVCLLGVVLLLMTEQFLAWRWGRRR